MSATRLQPVLGAALAVAALAALPAATRGDLASRYESGQQRAGDLEAEIQSDTSRIQGFEGTRASLEARLAVLQRSLVVQERLLDQVDGELADARARLSYLEVQYARDRRLLAAQLVADYEAPPPTLINVVVDAAGFDDLLNRLRDLKAIARANVRMTQLVRRQRAAVTVETRQLAAVQGRRRRATASVLVERDQVAQLRLSIVEEEIAASRDRARSSAELQSLRRTLAREASALERSAAAAEASASGGAVAAPPGCGNTPFVPHGGNYGFFPAPGTNYSVGEEPIIAARLDTLGQALQLHLIGISGYRTPQHSVEVGGFADDPHTRGEASDTPGVEGVPETTLERFCLTRPFPGPREADHIQES